MKRIIAFLFLLPVMVKAQLPAGAQWGCPSIPLSSKFDTVCFLRTSELKLGQGYFDHYGASDPVYFVIPENRPSFALSIAISWNYYRNVLGNDGMNINQWSATLTQENGFATYYGVQLPATVYDESSGTNVSLPNYPRGQNDLSMYNIHVGNNLNDGPFHFTVDGYRTASPYFPQRFLADEATYHPLYTSNLEMAAMAKTFYDISIYRRAELMNGIDLAAIEAASNDPYGIEAATAFAYNIGPNSGSSVSSPGYVANEAAMLASGFWAQDFFPGGVSSYAQRVSAMTAVLDDNEAYAKANWPAAANWEFYSFYDELISWDTVAASIDRLLIMYPEINASNFKSAVKAKFDAIKGGSPISFRYEMGAVIDEIILNLPKEDPGFNGMYAINGSGCKLGCRAPYATVKPQGPTTICTGQYVLLKAEVDGATSSVTYQWQKDGVNIPGATSQTYNATTPGSYNVIVCWASVNEVTLSPVTCCAQSRCEVDVTVIPACSNCTMSLALTPIQNSCTSMPDGGITVDLFTVESGPYEYRWFGPSSGSHITSDQNYTITGLRDGKYTVEVRKVSDHACRAVLDVTITPVTQIKETLIATMEEGDCATQLDAILVNQQPNTCILNIYYGSLNAYSWDRAFSMELKANGSGILTMYEGYTSTTSNDDPWDWTPFNWPDIPAPNSSTITVADGDTLSLYGIVLVPTGTAAPGFIDGGIRMTGATFTNIATDAESSSVNLRYQGPSPTPGARKIGDSYKVTCPLVNPPAYTYNWTPTSGLNNPNIKNPVASVGTSTVYTVTATHPDNTSCKLTASVTVPPNCITLPVVFNYFEAYLVGEKVNLLWGTSYESECREYQVQRSIDGYNYETIATLSCANKLSYTTYQAIDNAPYSGTSYYRIAEVDYNGAISFSQVKVITFTELTAHIYPNPFSKNFTLTLNGSEEEMVTIRIVDIQSKILSETVFNANASVELGEQLIPGVYIVEIQNGRGLKQYKLVKH
ncbi:MAG TPA: T9SS type A sorting domain-containing protein [Cytophagaceae bacterium]